MEHGYYLVKFYNHAFVRVMKYSSLGWEAFKSDPMVHDEIEWFKLIENGGVLRWKL